MKRFLLIPIAAGLAACVPDKEARNEIDNVKAQVSDLQKSVDAAKSRSGAFWYLGVDPQLSISVEQFKFSPAKGEYSSPEVDYSFGLKQGVDIDLGRYSVEVFFGLYNPSGVKVDQFAGWAKVEGGIAAGTGRQVFYSMRGESIPVGYSIKPINYTWWPEVRHQFVGVE